MAFLTSCKSTEFNASNRISISTVNGLTKDNNCTYMCTTYEILRVRHLSELDIKDSLFISFEAYQEFYEIQDSITVLYACVELFNNCILIFNKHKLCSYSNNRYEDSQEMIFENGIEYKIWLNDSLNSSYFFKFEDLDENIRKMDFELLPNMIGKNKKNAIQH